MIENKNRKFRGMSAVEGRSKVSEAVKNPGISVHIFGVFRVLRECIIGKCQCGFRVLVTEFALRNQKPGKQVRVDRAQTRHGDLVDSLSGMNRGGLSADVHHRDCDQCDDRYQT